MSDPLALSRLVPLLAFDSSSAPEFVSGHADLLAGLQGGNMKKLLVATYDISALTDAEAASLSGEVHAQAEDSDGHPSVEVTVAEHSVSEPSDQPEYETYEVLVHLNIEVPTRLGFEADQIAEAVMAAYGIGAEGATDPLYEDMKVVVALAEEV